jgi:hypothetical protein
MTGAGRWDIIAGESAPAARGVSGDMKRRLLAVAIGFGAGLLLLGAYLAALNAGIHLRPDLVMAGSAALVFAGAVALFALVTMDRPAFRSARAALPLNEDPAKEYIFFFRGPATLQITARPDMSVGEMLVRFGDAFKATPDKMTKPITVTLKGSAKKPFAAMTLQQLFAVLKPFNLEHVLLMDDRDELVGYIPGKRALKEFTDDKAKENIDKFVVNVLIRPMESPVLRELGGLTGDDTIKESETAFDAAAQLWKNEKVQGLIVQRKLKPVGFISKVDVLRINAGLL